MNNSTHLSAQTANSKQHEITLALQALLLLFALLPKPLTQHQIYSATAPLLRGLTCDATDHLV